MANYGDAETLNKQLRRHIVKLHVNSLNEESNESLLADDGTIANLLNDLIQLYPTLLESEKCSTTTCWLTRLCNREGGLGQATQALSSIRKIINKTNKGVARSTMQSMQSMQPQGNSRRSLVPPVPTSSTTVTETKTTENNTIVPPPVPPPVPTLVQQPMAPTSPPSTDNVSRVVSPTSPLFSQSNTGSPNRSNSSATKAPTTSQTTAPPIESYEQLREAEEHRLDLFRKRAAVAAEVEAQEIENIMKRSLSGVTSARGNCTVSLPNVDAHAPFPDMNSDQAGNSGGVFGTLNTATETATSTTGSLLSGLENIAATPLKAYRPPLFDHAKPPPTPTPEVDFRVPMPSAYPQYRASQSMDSHQHTPVKEHLVPVPTMVLDHNKTYHSHPPPLPTNIII